MASPEQPPRDNHSPESKGSSEGFRLENVRPGTRLKLRSEEKPVVVVESLRDGKICVAPQFLASLVSGLVPRMFEALSRDHLERLADAVDSRRLTIAELEEDGAELVD